MNTVLNVNAFIYKKKTRQKKIFSFSILHMCIVYCIYLLIMSSKCKMPGSYLKTLYHQKLVFTGAHFVFIDRLHIVTT